MTGTVRPPQPHRWQAIALGRVCTVCNAVQETGHFDDTPNCAGAKPATA